MQNSDHIPDLSHLLNKESVADKHIAELLGIYLQHGMTKTLLSPFWEKLKLVLESLISSSQTFVPYASLVTTTLLLDDKPLHHERISQECINKTIRQILNCTISIVVEKIKNPLLNLSAKIKGVLLETIEELAFSALDEKSRQEKLAFTYKELKELFELTQTILKLSKENTKFIFLGRSPLWIYYLMKELKIKNDMYCFPISGAIYSSNEAQQKAYIEFLKSKNTIFNKSTPSEFIVIDIVDSGKTLDDFCTWLEKIAQQSNLKIYTTKFKIHKFGQKPFSNEREVTAEISSTLFDKITSKHRCYSKYTPGLVFYPSSWEKWQQSTFDIINPPMEEHAKPRIAQLQKFINYHQEKPGIAYKKI